MPELLKCPQCGGDVSAALLDGQCPRCLLIATVPGGAIPAPGSVAQVGKPFGSVGEYELIEAIASGGMGMVYKARQPGVNRIVALKLLPFGPFTRDEVVRRFRSEAEAVGKLHHPGIVTIFEVGEAEGHHYFSMEYIEGPNLAEAVRDQPMPAARAARLVRSIAEAVEHAHQHGILHRDLKPSNILLDALDQVHVTDFGLARALGQSTELTLSGTTLGSPNYMPPEQVEARSAELGRPSDVYAMGAILYHLVTGRPPFAGDSVAAILQQVVQAEPVPPCRLNPSLPRDLESICLKCLEKEPARRYATACELAEELGRFQRHEPIHARPVGAWDQARRWCRRRPGLSASLGAALVFLLAGLLTTFWQWRRAESHSLRLEQRFAHEQIRRAEELFDHDHSGRGLALLADIVRADPANRVAVQRLISALTDRNFSLPDLPRLRHSDRVVTVRFNRQGSRLVTASADGTARVWDARSGEPMGSPLRHQGAVHLAEFSPDGDLVLTASADGTARIWKAADGQHTPIELRHQSGITWAGFVPDGRSVATAALDGTARMWEASTGRALTPWMQHAEAVLAADLSPDGHLLACASADRRVTLWRTGSGEKFRLPVESGPQRQPLVSFSPQGEFLLTVMNLEFALLHRLAQGDQVPRPLQHGGQIRVASFSRDGSRIVTGAEDQVAHIWDARDARLTTPPLRHQAPVEAAVFSHDGRYVATASADGAARIWDAQTGAPFSEPMLHASRVSEVCFSPDGRRFLTASWDGTACVWNITPGAARPLSVSHSNVVRQATFSPAGDRFVTAGQDELARVWETRTGRELTPPLAHARRLTLARFSPDGRWILTGSWDWTARVWNAITGEPVTAPLTHGDFVLCGQFTSDNRRVLTGSRNGEVRLWDASTGELQTEFHGHAGGVNTLELSRDGRLLVTASRDGTARIWEVATGRESMPPLRHNNEVASARFDPAGRRVVTASEDWSARVWDARTGQPLTPPLDHLNNVFYAEFSTDGRLIATASADRTARLWVAATGEPLPHVLKHAGQLRHLQFSPNGQHLATASEDGTARVWDVRSGHAVSEPFRHGQAVRGVQFSPDGQRLLTASEDDSARVWDLTAVHLPAPNWLPELAEAVGGLRLTGEEIFHFVPAGQLLTLRERLLREAVDGPYHDWIAWFFADRSNRRPSPWSATSDAR